LIATAAQVLAWSLEASVPGGPTRLLDVRLIDEFLGTDVRAARGGRIPGAQHRLFTDFVAPDGRLRPAAEVLAIVKGSGVHPDELRATYCQGGIRAALAWFVLSEIAGLTQVRNYAESWEEWGNRPELPIER
jgi:thiosulfate/3-mercaptopyruvate sulfurtransferase